MQEADGLEQMLPVYTNKTTDVNIPRIGIFSIQSTKETHMG